MTLRYLDASVVIDTTEPLNPRRPTVVAAIESYPLEEFRISDLVRLECLVHPTRRNDLARLAQLGEFFGSVPALSMPSEVFDHAVSLRAHEGLKTADALHVATALHHGCAEFWTNDRELARKDVGLTIRSF